MSDALIWPLLIVVWLTTWRWAYVQMIRDTANFKRSLGSDLRPSDVVFAIFITSTPIVGALMGFIAGVSSFEAPWFIRNEADRRNREAP